MEAMSEWHNRFGGIYWRVTPAGVEVREEGLPRTAGEPITMRRMLRAWEHKLAAASLVSGCPIAILMMTAATEGALSWSGEENDFRYPSRREEPGYVSDEATPSKVSLGPMHVLLSTYRAVMSAPAASARVAGTLAYNLLAGGFFMRDGVGATGWDPVLVAARYNAGSLIRADDPTSRFYNRWHLRSWEGHLDRSVRWYNDALAVLQEAEWKPPLPGAPAGS